MLFPISSTASQTWSIGWFELGCSATWASLEGSGEGDDQSASDRCDGVFDVAFWPDRGAAGSWTIGKARFLALRGGRGGKSRSLADEESISGDAQRRVVVETAPSSTFEMREPQFALEFLVVALDPPAQFGDVDEFGERRVLRQGREPIFGRRRLALRPFDEQPLDAARLASCVILAGRAHTHGRETGGEIVLEPSRQETRRHVGQLAGQLLGRDRAMQRVSAQARRRLSAAAAGLGRQGFDAGRPHAQSSIARPRPSRPSQSK